MKKLLLIALLIVGCDNSTEPQECTGVSDGTAVEDIDGNCYATVRLGTQLWMAENLKVTHYQNGEIITSDLSDEEWANPESGAYAIYPADSSTTCEGNCAEVYGNLYNWYVIDDVREVCPAGWHVPSDEEFIELEMFLSGYETDSGWTLFHDFRGEDEGSKLAGNSVLWNSSHYGDGPNDIEDNSAFGTSGFNALPAGRRSMTGTYHLIGETAIFWLSSESSLSSGDSQGFSRLLTYPTSRIGRFIDIKQFGYSIRCLKD